MAHSNKYNQSWQRKENTIQKEQRTDEEEWEQKTMWKQDFRPYGKLMRSGIHELRMTNRVPTVAQKLPQHFQQ